MTITMRTWMTLLLLCAAATGCQYRAGAPYVETEYFFGQPGASRELTLLTHAFRAPEVALTMPSGAFVIPQNRKAPPLSGHVTAEAFQGSKLVETITLEPKAYWHNGEGRVHSISLGAFQHLGMLPRNTRFVVTVHEPLRELGQVNPAVKVVLRPSPIP